MDQHIKTFGTVDERSLKQLRRCMSAGDAEYGVLCADHHPGYSQPIGGAIGYEGYVSPSGVGYDIGCIAAGTPVTTADGYTLPIERVGPLDPAVCWDSERIRPIAVLHGGVARGTQRTIAVALADGTVVRATPDHEFRTKHGWVRADELGLRDAVAVSPFVGLPHRRAGDIPLDVAPPTAKRVPRLEEMGLWPLRASDRRFPAILRVLAYCAGDGNLSPSGGSVCLYTSEADDVGDLTRDLEMIGFTPRVYRRDRGGKIRPQWVIKVGSVHLHALLAALGCPVGKKVDAWPGYPMPWLDRLPAWARAVFLSAFMSAEGMTPRITAGAPALMAVKQTGTTRNAIDFVARIFASLGFELSVTKSGPATDDGRQSYVGQVIGGESATLRYLREIGFNRSHAKRVASAAVYSVGLQRAVKLALRKDAIETGRELVEAGGQVRPTCEAVALTHDVPKALVYHGLYGRGQPRNPKGWRPDPDHTGEIAWIHVVDVTDAGEADVFDVATGDVAESFFAGGVCVHNCGNKAALTDTTRADLDERGVQNVMNEIAKRISFGMGVPASERTDDHPVLDKIYRANFAPQRKLYQKAQAQLGTVGSGNHFVNLFADEQDRVWVGVHFGSRGFGHKTASGFLALAQGLPFDGRAADGEMDSPPVLLGIDTDLGQAYIEAMTLAGEYAYAGRDVVVDKVLDILGASAVHEVHNHHNFAWLEEHNGRDMWVVRKGCTPAQPGQEGFVGGSMGEPSVILEGAESDDSALSLYSTVHGAGRVMSRSKAAGRVKRSTVYECSERDCDHRVPAKAFDGTMCPQHPHRKMRKVRTERVMRPGVVDWPKVQADLAERGIVVVGGGADEAPEVYKRLPEVLAAHGDSIRVKHTLTPLGVAMAGADVFDPYKD